MNRDVIKKYKNEFDAWLDGEQIQNKQQMCCDGEFEWIDCRPDWGIENFPHSLAEYRIKPPSRLINGVECAEPLKNLNGGVFDIYTIRLDKPEMYVHNEVKYLNRGYLPMLQAQFHKGIIFATKEEAIQTSEAILSGLKI